VGADLQAGRFESGRHRRHQCGDHHVRQQESSRGGRRHQRQTLYLRRRRPAGCRLRGARHESHRCQRKAGNARLCRQPLPRVVDRRVDGRHDNRLVPMQVSGGIEDLSKQTCRQELRPCFGLGCRMGVRLHRGRFAQQSHARCVDQAPRGGVDVHGRAIGMGKQQGLGTDANAKSSRLRAIVPFQGASGAVSPLSLLRSDGLPDGR